MHKINILVSLVMLVIASCFWLNPSITVAQTAACDEYVDYRQTGIAFLAQDKFGEAIGVFSCAIDNDPGNPEFYLFRASARIQIDQFEGALDDLEQISDLSPTNSYATYVAYLLRGSIFQIQMNYEAAIAEYVMAIESPYRTNVSDPATLAAPFIGLADIYEELGEYQLALNDAETALQISPDTASFYAARGFIYERLGDEAAAVADWNKAMLLDAKVSDSYGRQGGQLYRLKQYDRALESFNRAIRLRSEPYAYDFLMRGFIQTEMNNCELAIEDLTEAMRLDAQLWQALFFRARCYLTLENYQQAVDDFTAYVARNALTPDSFLFRALAFTGLGDLSAAQRDYEHYLELVQLTGTSLDTERVTELLERIAQLEQQP